MHKRLPLLALTLSVVLAALPSFVAHAARLPLGGTSPLKVVPSDPVMDPYCLSLPLALVVESIVVLAVAWRLKWPIIRLLAASVIANILSQFVLYGSLAVFVGNFLTSLIIAEILVCLFEAAVLKFYPKIGLSWRQSLLLSLGMNALSLAVGYLIVA